jgi:hypothetical protein
VDDGFAAELALGDGKHRTFFKFTEFCAARSRFTAQRVPEPP